MLHQYPDVILLYTIFPDELRTEGILIVAPKPATPLYSRFAQFNAVLSVLFDVLKSAEPSVLATVAIGE